MEFRRGLGSFFCAVLGVGGLMACQSTPTTVTEKTQILENAKGTGLPDQESGQVVPSQVVVLDARPSFIATVQPLRQAQVMDWRDFTRRVPPRAHALDADLFFHARRLARMGISPETSVLVVGRGDQGQGEEGRLVWTLRYLGIRGARMAAVEDFRPQMQNYPSSPPEGVPIWKPEVLEGLLETRSRFLTRIKENQNFILLEIPSKESSLSWPENAVFGQAERLHLSKEDLMKQARFEPDQIRSLLGPPGREIVVVDAQGETAAYATVLLRDWGYNASCACQGFEDLVVRSSDVERRALKK